MPFRLYGLILLCSLGVAPNLIAEDPVAHLKVPAGFTVKEISGPAQANDIQVLHVDARGRVMVAGRGYVRELRPDGTVVDLISQLNGGPMGLLREEDDLYVVVDGGLKRYKLGATPTPGASGETLIALKTGGEHDSHAVRRGPDGWLYLLCGNTAGVNAKTATGPRSPIKQPVAGALLRRSPDGKHVEIDADGFRNAYDFDFSGDGEPYTFDSDNERCVGLPWYEPTRFYRITPGGHHGWRNPQFTQTWRYPPQFPDVIAPTAKLGRGSPTGVTCYRHTAFPAHFQGGFFLADWTFGTIWFVPQNQLDGTMSRPEVFLRVEGENGFAPTGLAVDPLSGDLLVSIGGRGTRGAVYRIQATKPEANARVFPLPKTSLDWNESDRDQLLREATGPELARRRKALAQIVRHAEQFSEVERIKIVDANIDQAEHDITALARQLYLTLKPSMAEVWYTTPRSDLAAAQRRLACAQSQPGLALTGIDELLGTTDPATQLVILRLIQIGHGDFPAKEASGTAFEGYTLARPVQAADKAKLLPVLHRWLNSPDAMVKFETGRTLAALGDNDPSTASTVLTLLEKSPDPLEKIHWLIVLARLSPKLSEHKAEVLTVQLLDLGRQVERAGHTRDRHWPLRIAEATTRLLKSSPNLATALVKSPEFGRAEHLLYARLPGVDGPASARRFLTADVKRLPDDDWTAGLVDWVGQLPPAETTALFERLARRGGLDEALLLQFARSPRAEWRARYLAGLQSLSPSTLEIACQALLKLQSPGQDDVIVPAWQALRRFSTETPAPPVTKSLGQLLAQQTGQPMSTDPAVWTQWAQKERPDLAKKLVVKPGYDAAAWQTRLASIPWAQGNAERGRRVFTQSQCAACHDGGQAVGPSLQGVTKRFRRDDLFTAILDPNRDISPRYRGVRVATDDGKVHEGIVIYDAVDGLILQVGPDRTVRVAGSRIESRRPALGSIMPSGLIDSRTDAEIADLYAYLSSLGSSPAKGEKP